MSLVKVRKLIGKDGVLKIGMGPYGTIPNEAGDIKLLKSAESSLTTQTAFQPLPEDVSASLL